MARVHYWELSSYNNGELIGKWFDLDGLTHDDHLHEISEWLSDTHTEKLDGIADQIEILESELQNTFDSEVSEKLMNQIDGLQKDYDHLEQYKFEEWIVGDTEEIPDQYVGEYSIDSEFFEYLELVENSHMCENAIQAGIDLGIPLESINDAYQGEFSSDGDFAESKINDQFGDLEKEIGWLADYFDYEKYAHNLMVDFYMEHNGFYFYRNY